VKEAARPENDTASPEVKPSEFLDLVDRVERAYNLIESLSNRTNTLVHLLDILNKRVDRLEARAEA